MHFDLPLPPVASAGLTMLSMVEMEAAPGPLGILSCLVKLVVGFGVVCVDLCRMFCRLWEIGAMMSADGPSRLGSLPRDQ